MQYTTLDDTANGITTTYQGTVTTPPNQNVGHGHHPMKEKKDITEEEKQYRWDYWQWLRTIPLKNPGHEWKLKESNAGKEFDKEKPIRGPPYGLVPHEVQGPGCGWWNVSII